MRAEHWSEAEIVAHLYGVGPDDGHLRGCADCARRLETLRRRQQHIRAAAPHAPEELLAAQRSSIFARIQQRERPLALRLLPALAAALMLLAAMLMNWPSPKPRPKSTVSDAQLFEDVFAIVSSAEPRAFEPVRSLFEAKQ